MTHTTAQGVSVPAVCSEGSIIFTNHPVASSGYIFTDTTIAAIVFDRLPNRLTPETVETTRNSLH